MTRGRPGGCAWWLVGLLLATAVPEGLGLPRKLHAAFAYLNTTSDLGWNWRHNEGRISMNAKLLELYPDLDVQTFYKEEVPQADPPDCPPVFREWGEQGMDIVVGDTVGHEACMLDVAPLFPYTFWLVISGTAMPPLPNWGVGQASIYQTVYLAGIVAGWSTKTGRVGAIMPVRMSDTTRDLAAFALGVRQANASVEVHVGWTGLWLSPPHEVLLANRLAELGCDIIFSRSDGVEALTEVNYLGLRSIGFNGDHRLPAGETILITPYYNWGVLYLQLAQLVLQGQAASLSPLDMFPGLQDGAVALSAPSFYVSRAAMAAVDEEQQRQLNGTDIFCGTHLTNQGTTVGQPGSCPTRAELNQIDWQPPNVVDHGLIVLPSEACWPGELPTWDPSTDSYGCTPCGGGTFPSVTVYHFLENWTCAPCPPGLVASRNASACTACPPGATPTAAQDACVAGAWSDTRTIMVASTGAGLALLIGCVASWYAWRATATLRALRRQFSNVNVAQECAEAIARLDLEAVAWLREARHPNKIQQAFLQIVTILTEVRPYIPDQLLCALTQSQLSSAEQRSQEPQAPSVRRLSEPFPFGLMPAAAAEPAPESEDLAVPPLPPHPPGTSVDDTAQPKGAAAPRPRRWLPLHAPPVDEWARRRCVYMTVQFAFPASGAKDAGEAVATVIRAVVGSAKERHGTIAHVTGDTVALHWGLASRVPDAPTQAALAALDLSTVRTTLPNDWQPNLSLSVIATHGACSFATISAGPHRFFVVRGAAVDQANDRAVAAAAARCQCDVLLSPALVEQAQHQMEFMPRCLVGGLLYWQPLGVRAAAERPEEWMYELRNMEEARLGRWGAPAMQTVFQMAANRCDPEAVRAEIAALRVRHGGEMSPQDHAALDHLTASL